MSKDFRGTLRATGAVAATVSLLGSTGDQPRRGFHTRTACRLQAGRVPPLCQRYAECLGDYRLYAQESLEFELGLQGRVPK
jgi:hypothetical protein